MMILSGLFMALTYSPTEAHAFASVEDIMRRLPSGWFLRLLHQGGVFALFVALYFHIGRGLWHGSYKIPRELTWLSGWVLFCGFLAVAFAGYCLPWGQLSYWAATVSKNALNAVPFPTGGLGSWLFGAASFEDIGNPSPATLSLQRLFIFHFAGAFFMLLLVAFHILSVHGLGMRRTIPEAGEVGCCHRPRNEAKKTSKTGACRSQSHCGQPNRRLPFYPYFVVNDVIGVVLILLLLFGVASFFPHLVSETDNLLPANPMRTPNNIHPPWYLAPFFAILRAVPSEMLGLIAVVLAVGSLALLPWLDHSPKTEMADRGILKLFFTLFLLAFAGLCFAGMNPPSANLLWLARLCLGWWLFYTYALLPFFAWKERVAKRKAHALQENSQ
ncbi:ubiquinol-cytochrome c reductase cytochrome b subunit [Lasius niger]|uniref:Cytochrome b n=1 Tax=Lasius niger TaxID=67767 RepID=A0A0J7KUJ5_LASNI|nr:ubiquinol-cytochrome c reductase cytochrome b subunit [Lasius niger]